MFGRAGVVWWEVVVDIGVCRVERDVVRLLSEKPTVVVPRCRVITLVLPV